MTVLQIILGVIMVICGFSCAFTPLGTFLASGYLIGILMLVYGIAGIIKAFTVKRYGLEFVVSILGTLIGLFALFRPGSTLAIDTVIVYLMAAFFVIQGIVAIVISLNIRKISLSKKWIWGIVIGVLAIIVGIYSFIHPSAMALTIGFLIGIYFIEAGINMIIFASTNNGGGAAAA